MNSLILLRGLPGAGKSTLAAELSEDKWPVFSIDSYFTDPHTGKYDFRYRDNHMAYKHCQQLTEKAMLQSVAKIFIDNTFTLDWEIEPYFKMAKEHGYRIFVLTVEKYHGGVNTHGITEEQLQKMAEKYRVRLL